MTQKTKTSRHPLITADAKALAARYRLVVERTESGRYIGSALEMPTVIIGDASEQECVRLTREGLALAVTVMRQQGKEPPSPISQKKRTQQVNVRLTAEEKLRLEETARNQGFRGISDFIRATALGNLRSA